MTAPTKDPEGFWPKLERLREQQDAKATQAAPSSNLRVTAIQLLVARIEEWQNEEVRLTDRTWDLMGDAARELRWVLDEMKPDETTPQVRCTHFSGKHTLETRCTWCNWPSDVATNGPPDETTDAEVDTFVDGLMAILCLGDSLKAPNTCREVTREAVRNFLARRPEEPRETKALPRLEYNRHCGECQRNKITIEVFAKAISKEPAPTRCAECQTPRLCRVERECLRNRYVRPAVEPADRTGGDPECFGSAGAPRSEDEYRARVNALALECARASAVVRSPEKAPEPLCDCGAEQRRQRGYHAQCYSFCASKKTNNPQQLPAKATDEPCKCVQYCAIYNKGTPGCRGLPLHPTDYYSSQNGKG